MSTYAYQFVNPATGRIRHTNDAQKYRDLGWREIGDTEAKSIRETFKATVEATGIEAHSPVNLAKKLAEVGQNFTILPEFVDNEQEEVHAAQPEVLGSMAIVPYGGTLLPIVVQLAPSVVATLGKLGIIITIEEAIEYLTKTNGVFAIDDWLTGDQPDRNIGEVLTGGLGGTGWAKVTRTKYDAGPRFNQKRTFTGYYKPYKQLTPNEVKAFWMGHYRAYIDGEKKANRSYVRGFNRGAYAQQKAEQTAESGGTPLVRYTRRR